MALFKFRWPGHKAQREQAPVRRSRMAQAESVEDMRRRALHRLIGAGVLVALGVIGFPLLFDTQPRPVPVDVPIEIPDRHAVAPLMVPAASSVPVQAPAAAPRAPAVQQALQQPEPAPALAVPRPPEPPRLMPVPDPVSVVARPEPEPRPEPRPQPSAPASEAERARALLEGRTPPPVAAQPANAQRFIVQVGAFADASKAAEVRGKLERAGVQTYTQVVETKEGTRTRVRVGPFDLRSEADQVAAQIKALGLAASVLTL